MEIAVRKQNFLQGKKRFFKNFDFNNRRKYEIQDKNEKISGLFNNTVFYKIHFSAFEIYRDRPPTWKLKYMMPKAIDYIYIVYYRQF